MTLVSPSRLSSGSASPIRLRLLDEPSEIATPTSSTPIAIEASRPRSRPRSVAWSVMPRAASRMPTRAAVSSNATVFTVGSGVVNTCRKSPTSRSPASRRSCTSALTHEVPSNRNETPRTTYATRSASTGSGCSSAWMPS